MNWLAPAALILIIGVFTLLAAKNNNGLQNRQLGLELKSEIKNYFDSNIKSDLLAWKTRLDNSMTAEDLAKLNRLRSQARDLREQFRAEMQQAGQQAGQGRRHGRQGQSPLKQEHRNQMQELVKQVLPLAQTYKTTLVAIGEEAREKSARWKSDIKEIIHNWKQDHQAERGNANPNRMGQFKGPHFGMDTGDSDNGKIRAAVRFMLWDGEEDFIGPRFQQRGNGQCIGTVGDPLLDVDDSGLAESEVKCYPNPFSDKTTITFTLLKPTKVTLTVYDGFGKQVDELCNGSLNEGSHSFVLDSKFLGLADGTYHYRLSYGTTIKTGNIVLSR